MLDPQIAELLPVLNAGFPRVETMTAPQARAAVRARLRPPAAPEPVAEVVDRWVPGPAGALPVRIYRPAVRPPRRVPIVVFAHGGGFVFCDLDTHDGLCRAISNGVGAVVVSVDYRLAPEARWPAAAEDVYAAAVWAAGAAAELGADPDRMVLAGDSAGGNLAAVTALLARDRGGPAIAAMALLYPVLAADFTTDSYRRHADGYYNTAAAMRWYWDQYAPDAADRAHRYATPLGADPAGSPPTLVVTAGFDPLCSEGDAYAAALAEARVPVIHRRYDGAVHGFLTMPDLDLTRRARATAWADITALLQETPQ